MNLIVKFFKLKDIAMNDTVSVFMIGCNLIGKGMRRFLMGSKLKFHWEPLLTLFS